jgi:hypothetical protein
MAMIPAFKFVLVFIAFSSPNSFSVHYYMTQSLWSLSVLSPLISPKFAKALNAPAFTFVLIFIVLLLSHLLNAVRMPIGTVLTAEPPERGETIALHGDHGAVGSRRRQPKFPLAWPEPIRTDSCPARTDSVWRHRSRFDGYRAGQPCHCPSPPAGSPDVAAGHQAAVSLRCRFLKSGSTLD